MRLLGFLLLPVVLTMGRLVRREKFYLSIDYTLRNIDAFGNPDDMDLSNLAIEALDQSVFATLNNLKSLNLANNSLSDLPKLVFANLTNLEYLNLADNALTSGQFYVGLSSLKTLNITGNKYKYFEPGHFFGLTKSTSILTNGIGVFTTPAMFENPTIASTYPPPRRREDIQMLALTAENNDEWLFEIWPILFPSNDPGYSAWLNASAPLGGEPKIKVCIKDGHLQSVDLIKINETLAKDCREHIVEYGTLDLKGLGIRTFEKGWYRLGDFKVRTLYLCVNEIARITEEILNDLPDGIRYIDLSKNKIERLERGIIKYNYVNVLFDLSNNRISEIEDGALENMNITYQISLSNNRLNNTKFLESLPSNIQMVSLAKNNISEISVGNFSKFNNFIALDIDDNKITEAKADRLREFSSLKLLLMERNALKNIEPGFFKGMKNLLSVSFAENRLSSLESEAFIGLEKINHIHLNSNNFTEVPSSALAGLPKSLEVLLLRDNQIKTLTAGSFVNVPTIFLDLTSNKISKIDKGSFNIPKLIRLDLASNLLKEIDGDCFEGLGNLGELSLERNNITIIKKGTAKNLGHLYYLCLHSNPATFENGALFGLMNNTDIQLGSNPVIIQGGLFDDV